MKKPALSVAAVKKVEKPTPPPGWERAGLSSIAQLLREHRDWIFNDSDESLLWALYGSDVETRRAAIILLHRQVKFWRRRYEGLRDRLPEGSSLDKYLLLQSALAALNALSPLEQKRAVDSDECRKPKFGGVTTRLYDWLADEHRNPELRVALGCKPSAFRKLCRDAGISAADTKGKPRTFTFREVVALLRVRLRRQRPTQTERVRIAGEIWLRIRGGAEKRRDELKRVLVAAGAECENLASVVSPPPRGIGLGQL